MNTPKVILHNRGLSYPQGFKVSALNCGIKDSGKNDLGLLYSKTGCNCVGMFSKNQFKAHPVIISQAHVKENQSKALIVNSGNANCLNGQEGYKNALKVVKQVAKSLDLEEEEIVIASTGIIGEKIPVNNILAKIPNLVDGLGQGEEEDKKFAEAIITTDTKLKLAATQIELGNKVIKIGGIVKGAGMIYPNLATMLAFFTTDINISKNLLDKAFRNCVGRTFENLNVDGQSSTNDMAVIFANGRANNDIIDSEDSEFMLFKQTLFSVCERLAYGIVKNAEGATKVIKINVKGASTQESAKRVANRVANSPLVKTFIYGQTPNWGRIIQALGGSSVKIKPSKVVVKVNTIPVFKNNAVIYKKSHSQILEDNEINIEINLNIGNKESFVLTCDLSPEYVNINSQY